MRYFGLSNKGMVRGNNEDFFHLPFTEDEVKFFVVADGMGGENAGEVASSLAVADATLFIKKNYKENCDIPLLLRQALTNANRTVFATAKADKTYESMGTTMVCALFTGDLVYVANVGDSRCYIIKNNELSQITVDHSYVQELVDKGIMSQQEASIHPNKNLITRAIGVDRFVSVDVFCKPWEKGDKLLLASDGLTGMVDAEKISQILNENNDCKQSVEALINKANEAGGKDNITAVLIAND